MNHIAIMKKSWGLIPMILNGKKKAESRWYKTKRTPWNKSKEGDIVYFKNSGEPVTVKSEVMKVLQYEIKNNKHATLIMKKHAKEDLGFNNIPKEIKYYIRGKKYAIFVFFNNVEKIKPFDIDKSGFGSMSAWITVDDIKSVKIPNV